MMVVAEPRVRPLTKEEGEIYSSAVVNATLYIRSFRDAIALIRPFYDGSAETAYTDRYARVGLGPWFFTLDKYQQATVVLHETMHVLNNHFVRFDSLGGDPKILNYAGDFEINSGLNQHPKVDLSLGILPNRDPYNYRPHLSMEQYYHLLNQDVKDGKYGTKPEDCPVHGDSEKDPTQSDGEQSGDDQGQSDSGQSEGSGGAGGSDGSDGSNPGDSAGRGGLPSQDDSQSGSVGAGTDQDQGQGSGDAECTCAGDPSGDDNSPGSGIPGKSCDAASEERSAAADDAGIDRASDAEQTIAKRNTAARIVEEIKQNKAQGNGHLNEFLEFAQKHLSPPKVSWQSIFRRVLSHSFDSITRGRADYSHRRVNRRSHDSEFIFPGMVQYIPTAMLGIDTSGSMDSTDFRRGLAEAEGILKSVSKAKNALRVFSIDTEIGDVRPVTSVSKIKLTGGGGTEMAPAWEYVTGLSKRNRPDVFVLVTDGGLIWDKVIEELKKSQKLYRSVVLITNKGAMDRVPDQMKKLAIVIDIS